MKKTILAIETSCDDTGVALVEADGGFSKPKFKVLKNLVSSQIKIHRPFGGVVPGLAKREHIKNLPLLLKKLLHSKFYILNSIDLIAVTVGPGLEPALWTGINFAQELHRKQETGDKKQGKRIKLIGVNHLEGHLYSFLLPRQKKTKGQMSNVKCQMSFPAVVLLVSGGHTTLLLMRNLKTWKRIGETRDDAAGEAFDKVARMLGLPYPGGPEIEKLANYGNPMSIDFPRPMLNQKNYDFSFSGLKTAVFYYIEAKKREKVGEISRKNSHKFASKSGVAASFQQAVIDVLVTKTMRAAKEFGARSAILCGGVAANKVLRGNMREAARETGAKFFVPEMEYNNDNAAMIAAAGYFTYLKGSGSAKGGPASGGKLPLKANGNLNI